MALVDLGRQRGQFHTLADRVRSHAAALLGAFADWNDTRRTRDVLSKLSAHELDDIGLTRADIDAIARVRRF